MYSTDPVASVDEDPYAVLHLRPTAPPAIIKAAWRELAKILHPDAGGDPKEFVRVKAAYDKLTKV
ncbi:J domain-containing protein [bacterium]|nr:J domain-containing protein [bacterium]